MAHPSFLTRDSETIGDWYEDHPGALDGFAGIEIDHARGGLLVVYLTEGAEAPWRDDLPHAGRLEIERVPRNRATLDATQQEIDSAWMKEEAGTADITLTALDPKRGKVVVGFRPSALEGLEPGEVPEGFAERFGRERFLAIPETPAVGTGWLRGGLGYDFNNGSGNDDCSFAFTAVRDNPSDPDDDWILSAGHCAVGRLWENVDRSTENVGPFVERLWRTERMATSR